MCAGGWDGYLAIWETVGFTLVKKWKAHKGYVRAVRFYNNILISAGADKEIVVWDKWFMREV